MQPPRRRQRGSASRVGGCLSHYPGGAISWGRQGASPTLWLGASSAPACEWGSSPITQPQEARGVQPRCRGSVGCVTHHLGGSIPRGEKGASPRDRQDSMPRSQWGASPCGSVGQVSVGSMPSGSVGFHSPGGQWGCIPWSGGARRVSALPLLC